MDLSNTPVGATFSPVTNLAFDLGGLSTTGYVATPRRRISWSSVGGDSPVTSIVDGEDRDGFPESLNKSFSDYCSPNAKDMSNENAATLCKPKVIYRHSKSLMLGSSPFHIDKENLPEEEFEATEDVSMLEGNDGASQDSGYSGSMMDKDMMGREGDSSSACMSSRRTLSIGSPYHHKPSPLDRYSSSSWDQEDELAGFLDQNIEDTQFPSGISKLIESPLCFRDVTNIMKDGVVVVQHRDVTSVKDGSVLAHHYNITPVRPLSHANKITEKHAFKRPEPPLREGLQNQQKRRRKAISLCSTATLNDEDMTNEASSSNHIEGLQRSYSESHTTIMRAVHRSCENPDLIGDFSRCYSLPLIQGKHQDLKTISSSTAMELLAGKYCDSVSRHVIIDCRYPYEYEGGHIKNAKNIYTKEGIVGEFLNSLQLHNSELISSILIFHCEFSSERGPSLMRFLRNKDRESNNECYPALHYPEIYLLEGGYKAFYEAYKPFCEPRSYIPMLHKDHEKDLKVFRAKSKSWNGDSKGRVSIRPGLKF